MRKINIFSSLVALLFTVCLSSYGQDSKAAIQKKLAAGYTVTQPTADNTDIVTAGSVLIIKRGRLTLAPITASNVYPNTYRDGKISESATAKVNRWTHMIPGTESVPAAAAGTRTFVPGEKLWLTQIEVKDDGIVFSLLSDPLPDVRYKGTLKFAYPKGFFPDPDAADRTVAEVFGIQPGEEGKGQQQAAAPPAQPPSQKPPAAEATLAPITPPPPPVDQPSAPPKTIAIGQTTNQVVSIFGAPQKDIKLGAKEIYTYPDLKVTFVNGKVSDVQ
ncbi:MAG TPA: hypothetical protein VGG97_12880 [Bryobacteraceae bacterium]